MRVTGRLAQLGVFSFGCVRLLLARLGFFNLLQSALVTLYINLKKNRIEYTVFYLFLYNMCCGVALTVHVEDAINIGALQILATHVLGIDSLGELLVELGLERSQALLVLGRLVHFHVRLLDDLVVELQVEHLGVLLVPVGVAALLVELMLERVEAARQRDTRATLVEVVVVDRIVLDVAAGAASKRLDDLLVEAHLLGRHQHHAQTLVGGAARRTTASMHVDLGRARHLVVDHVHHARYVEAARRHVRRDQARVFLSC